jgi:hypothetical protein
MAEVTLVRWPEGGDDGMRLAATGAAVLYLVSGDDAPPVPTTCLEDWVRVPGDERDLTTRVAALEVRAAAHQRVPHIDNDGRLHYRGSAMKLPAEELALARLLTERFGDVVPDSAFEHALGDPVPVLRAPMAGLRARLRDLGLTVRRVRRRGYMLKRR